MVADNPEFWWHKSGFLRYLLSPFSFIYGRVAARRMEKKDVPQIDLPVLCIGNFTLGGAGKTPVAIAVAKAAHACGLKPGIVSRGYGGSHQGIHLVDLEHDRARDVGDEPLLLARHATVAISVDRLAGAKRLKENGCDFIIMDDGFQSRRLQMDYALIVVDALRGIGNGAVFPAGPLRAPLLSQLSYTDGLLVIGEGAGGDAMIRMGARAAKPLQFAKLEPQASHDINGVALLAFAGIGNPQKFFRSLSEMGGYVQDTRIYADHHFFTDYDLNDMRGTCEAKGLRPVTTAKDFVRIKTDHQTDKLPDLIVADVEVAFEDDGFCNRLIDEVLERFRLRQLK